MRNDRIRIVIADDEQNICEMLKRLIRFDDLGLELIGMVSNGEDLRNVIVKEKPDIVITDIRMPIVDGIRFAKELKEKLPKVRVWRLSDGVMRTDAKRILSCSVDIISLNTLIMR